MSENKTILTTRRFELWWRKVQAWFATQFASINVDLTSVEEKVDDVKSDVADVKTAVENIDFSTLARETQATSNKNEVKQEIRTVAGNCIIPDFEEEGLALTDVDGFCSIYLMEEVKYGSFGKEALHCAEYKVGSIIKVTGENDYQGNPYFVAVTGVSDVDNLKIESDTFLYGYTDILFWQKDHYYRVTGIYDCENRVSGGTEKLFTYEEIDPVTITDMGKKIVEKLDEVKEATAKETTAQEIKELVLEVLENMRNNL